MMYMYILNNNVCHLFLFSFVSVRKWKSKSGLGKEGKWEFEIGEDMRPVNLDLENITESRGNVSGSLTQPEGCRSWMHFCVRYIPNFFTVGGLKLVHLYSSLSTQEISVAT